MARKLEVVYGADTSQVRRALRQVDDDHSRFGQTLATLGRAGAVAFASIAAGAATAFGVVVSKGLKMNAELETATLQFKNMMGSAEQAEEHVKGLFKFAAATPFETAPIVEASRHLQLFGGAALNTTENLTRVGNAAARANQNIEEVSFWISRAYSSIQAGRPFGEASMRLQEMGVLSAETRTKMEDLQKAGASGAEVWAVLTAELDSFNGAMLEQSTSWKGLFSTLSDVFAMGATEMTQPLFESIKGVATELIAFSNSPAWAAILEKGRAVFGKIAEFINAGVAAFKEGGMAAVFEHLSTALSMVLPFLGPFGVLFSAIAQAATEILPALSQVASIIGAALAEALRAIAPVLPPLAQAFADILRAVIPLVEPLAGALTQALIALAPLITVVVEALTPWLPILGQLIADLIPPLISFIQELTPIIGEMAPVVLDLIQAFLPLLPVIAQLIRDLLPHLIPLIKQAADAMRVIMPVIVALAPLISDLLVGAIQQLMAPLNLAKTVVAAFQAVLDGVSGAIKSVIRWIGEMIDKLKNLSLPSFLQRSSPSPLETALWNSAAGMKALVRATPSTLGFDLAGSASLSAGGALGVGGSSGDWGGAISPTVHIHVQGSLDREAVPDIERAIEQAFGRLVRGLRARAT